MKNILPDLAHQYKTLLNENGIPDEYQHQYLKWLRYYLVFCHKYQFDDSTPSSLPHFIEKLKGKKQTEDSQKLAHSAIRLYYAIIQSTSLKIEMDAVKRPECHEAVKEVQRPFVVTVANNTPSKPDADARSTRNEKWKHAQVSMANEIKLRHYSPKTLKTYTLWARKMQAFLKSKDPATLSTDDVKTFLTHLAVDQHVSASSQNQAFNALLFLSDGTIFMKAEFRRSLRKRLIKQKYVKEQRRTPFATAMQVICCMLITIYERFRNYWGKPISEPR